MYKKTVRAKEGRQVFPFTLPKVGTLSAQEGPLHVRCPGKHSDALKGKAQPAAGQTLVAVTSHL